MDKFVVRLPAPERRPEAASQGSPKFKQTTIESLKGVVVLEDIQRAKVILERSEVSAEEKVNVLEDLSRKRPAKEILIKTEIGRVVHRLCKHSNPDVASVAKTVYNMWKQDVLSKTNRPMIEVRCDAKTEQMRKKGRELVLSAIQKGLEGTQIGSVLSSAVEETDELVKMKNLSEHIEREVYRVTKKGASKSYQRTMRKVIFALTYKKEITAEVVSSKKSVENLIKIYLASS